MSNIISKSVSLFILDASLWNDIPLCSHLNSSSIFSDLTVFRFLNNGALFYALALFIILLTVIFLLFKCNRDNKKRIQKQQDYLNKIEDINKGLEVAKQKVQEANQLKMFFLANISHELRTPLNSIVGFSELLTEGDNLSHETVEQYSRSIRVNSDLLLNLINDITDLSKIETNQLQVQYKEFDLHPMMDELYEYAQKERNELDKAEIKVTLDKGIRKNSFYIKSDENRLRQVFINLINNAVKFTTSGEIRIGYRLNGSHLLFYVKDTGMGFTNEEYKEMFDSFRQGREGTNRRLGGAGLGLTLSRGIVENLNGKIWAVANEGNGSVFYFQIPFLPPTKKENKKSGAFELKIEEQYNWSGKKLLVVEDSYMAYELITKLLKGTGAEFSLESDGYKAMERCEKDLDIDLVLMDIQLPFIDGYEATRRIKEIRPNLPVIAQTANAMMDDRKRALEAGCEDYVAKPLDRIELAEKINNLLFRIKEDM
ncbi:MAG: response regulator [Bacteroidales bacterium]